jgi:hypothetical protein
MKSKLYEYYEDFLNKKSPPNVPGEIYSLRKTLNENYIPLKDRRYNSKGNIINESINDILIPNMPVNKKINFDQGLMVKAIQNGLVILINYSGDKDNWKGGRERVIYPMVIGINRNTGNMLIRAWHLTGWSVSKKRSVKKEWRLFKASNIKSMMFTGDFYRLPPKGYKMNDRIMTERIIKSADFNEIRRNQDSLVKAGKLELMNKQIIGKEESSVIAKIDSRTTDSIIDLRNPFNNEYVKEFEKRLDDLKITFMKNINKNEYVAIIGALGTVNRSVKLYDDKEFIGNYKVKKSIKGREIRLTRNVDGKTEFPLYTFNSVIN